MYLYLHANVHPPDGHRVPTEGDHCSQLSADQEWQGWFLQLILCILVPMFRYIVFLTVFLFVFTVKYKYKIGC